MCLSCGHTKSIEMHSESSGVFFGCQSDHMHDRSCAADCTKEAEESAQNNLPRNHWFGAESKAAQTPAQAEY